MYIYQLFQVWCFVKQANKIRKVVFLRNQFHWKWSWYIGYFRAMKVNNLRNPAKLSLFKKPIYKTRNTGTGNEMWGMLDTQGMFTGTPVNLLEDSGEWYHFRILRNVEEDFRECSRRFQEMLAKILVNISKHSGYCSSRSRGMPV